jgi:hypothetical protein
MKTQDYTASSIDGFIATRVLGPGFGELRYTVPRMEAKK